MDDELVGGDRAGQVLLEGGAPASGLGHAVGVDDHAVLALGLGQVHGEVGVAQQRVRGPVAGSVEEATPTLARTVTGPPSSGDGQGEAGEHALGDAAGDVGAAVDDERELVTADAGHHVAGAHAAAQPLGEGHQQLVALRRGRGCR